MFFLLSKLLTWLLYPLSWIILLPLFTLIPRWRRHRVRMLWCSFLLTLFFTNPFLSRTAVRSWETPAVRLSSLSEHCSFAIVLSGMASWNEELQRVEFYQGADRLWQALELYKAGKVDKILITGGSGSVLRQQEKEAVLLRDYLLRLGIPATDIVIEPNSKNTRENAIFTKKLLDSLGVQGKQYLVTSGYHMRRAEGCFIKAGIAVIPYTADRYSGQKRIDPAAYLVPNPWSMATWNLVIHEWTGYLIYKWMGYL